MVLNRTGSSPVARIMESHQNILETSRQNHMESIRNMGIDPYGSAVSRILPINSVRKNFEYEEQFGQFAEIKDILVQGRIYLKRDNGNLVWFQISDDSGSIQVAVSKKNVSQ